MARKRRTRKKRNTGNISPNGVVSAKSPGNGKTPAGKRPLSKRVSKKEQRREAKGKAERMKRIRFAGLAVLVLALIIGAVAWLFKEFNP